MKKKITDIWKFLTYDIWRITEDEVTRTKFSLYNIIKTIYLCINRFTKDRMANKASALTYSTLLAIVPPTRKSCVNSPPDKALSSTSNHPHWYMEIPTNCSGESA